MSTSGAQKPTKRAKKLIKDLQTVKNTYISYYIPSESAGYKEVMSILESVEDFIVEISAGKRVMEAELAEKIKNDIEEV
jgi:predicted RNA-binding protein with EMAP domain